MTARDLLPGRRVTSTISAITRRRNSLNGNPAYRIALTDGQSFTTKTDCFVGLRVCDSWEGRRFTLVIDGRGQIIDAEESDQ